MLMMARKRADVIGNECGARIGVAGADAWNRGAVNVDQLAMLETDGVTDGEFVMSRSELRHQYRREQEQNKRSTESSPEAASGENTLVVRCPHQC